jgi:putative DNA primase/helicase
MTAAAFAQLVKGARRRADGVWWDACCPAHDDRKASLSFRNGDHRLILKCQAGCEEAAILMSLHLTVADLARSATTGRARIVAEYDYCDADGALVYQVVRFDPKDFRSRRPDGAGGWTWNINGVARVPYRLPSLTGAERVYVPESEKDVDALCALGLVATCNTGGAGKWRASDTAALVKAGVPELVVLPDHDAAGEAHAVKVVASCLGAGLTVRIVRLPNVAEHGDVTDWLAAGGTREALEALVAATAPASRAAQEPATPTTDRSERPERPLTDLGNSERFVQQHGEIVRYVYAWKTWLLWDRRRWARDPGDGVARLMKQTVKAFYRDIAVARTAEERAKLFAHAVRSESEAGIRHALELAKSDVAITPDQLDRDPWLLNCPNGTLELKTRILRPHRPEDYLTKLTAAPYEPEARHSMWTAFLETALPDVQVRAFLQRFAEYALTADTSEETLVLAHGPTAGGKTTFLESLRRAWGDYAASVAFSTFLARRHDGPREDVARLAGVRLCTSVEPRMGGKLAEGLVKILTGGDSVVARKLYENSVEFVPEFKILWAANHRPRVSDTDEAFWRRVKEAPFTLSLPKERRDPTIKATLTDPTKAGPAILAWAVDGCGRWRAEGLGEPPAVEQATRAYRESMGPLSDFLGEYCTLGPGRSVTARTLRDAYETFCRERGERYPLTGRVWADALRARGCTDSKGTGGVRLWRGIDLRLTEPPESPATAPDEPGADDVPF